MGLLSFFLKNKGLSIALAAILGLFVTAWIQSSNIDRKEQEIESQKKDISHLMLRVYQLKKDSADCDNRSETFRNTIISMKKDWAEYQKVTEGSSKGLSSELPDINNLKKKK